LGGLDTIRQSSFVRSVGVLVTGASFAQLISLVLLPLLTRVFSPQDFEVLAVFSALAMIFSFASCLGFDFALPIARTREEGVNLLVAALFSVTLVTILVAAGTVGVIFLLPQAIGENAGDYSIFIWLLPLSVFLIGWQNAFDYWATRHKRFGLISKARIAQAAIGGGAQIMLGLAGAGTTGLLIGYLLINTLGLLPFALSFWKNDRDLLKEVRLGSARWTAASYGSFPRYTAIEAFANGLSVHVPILIISAALVGPEAGFVMLAMRLLQGPLFLISRSVSQVYQSRSLDAVRGKTLPDDTAKVIRTLAGLATGPLIAVAILASDIIPFILGSEWRPVGVYLAWFVPWLYLHFLSSSILTTMYVLARNHIIMWLTLAGLAFRVSLILLSAIFAREFVIITYAVTSALFYGVSLGIFMRANHISLRAVMPQGLVAQAALAGPILAALLLKLLLSR